MNKYIHNCQRRRWHPTPVLFPGKSHGQRSLVGCRPWDLEESDTTERLHFHFSLSCIGEGNGNPLQCSCLENPRDGGAWWAVVSGVSQSQTRLKRLSSSSSILCYMEVPHTMFVLYLLAILCLRESGEIEFQLGRRSDWFVKLIIHILHLLCNSCIFFLHR